MATHNHTAFIIQLALAAAASCLLPVPHTHGGDGCCLEHRLEALRWSLPADADQRLIPGFDADSGRNLRNYPPHRYVDYHHMRLEFDIPDMNTPRLHAVQTLTISPIAQPLQSLSLDAMLLDIHSVTAGGQEASFEYDGTRLDITFDPAVPAGTTTKIVTTYTLDDPPFGLLWTLPSSHWPGRAAQIHTQGQPDRSRYWFPIHDFPNIRLSTELLVTVPLGYQVLSNGRLVEAPRETSGSGGGDSRITWHWRQERPHVPYLVSLIVGKFDIVDVARPGDAIAMPVYVPPGRADDVPGTYGRTPRMMDLFEQVTSEPYPWDKYAHAVVWNFAHGGMENTSATTMHDTAILTRAQLADQDIEGLIAHELAHQWFGNLITCNSWEHIWLNEGFATYFTNLWWEERDGRDAYFDGVIGNFDRVVNVDRADAPYQPAMASKVYDDPWDTFRRAANPYPKGAAVLHMLRQKLGDDRFFRGIALYIDRMRDQSAETSDLRRAFEDASGENLEQFFNQWVFRPGVPRLDIDTQWDSAASELVITITQSQNIDGYNPAFEFDLPIWVSGVQSRSTEPTILTIPVAARQTAARFRLDVEPHIVAVDPEMSVLAFTRIRQPNARWIAQLEQGPTLFARVRAARALAGRDTAIAGAPLLAAARNPANHPRLRAEAARAMSRGRHIEPLLELAASAPAAPDARLAMVEAVAALARDRRIDEEHRMRFKDVLVRHASKSESLHRTRAAALAGLGRMGAVEHFDIIAAALGVDSLRDRVRQAALDALGDLGEPQGLPIAIRHALPGTFNRTRPHAMRAMVKLAEHDFETVFRVLTMTLSDRERRAWEAAGDALVELGDARALESLQSLLESRRDPGDRARVQQWIDALQSAEAAITPSP